MRLLGPGAQQLQSQTIIAKLTGMDSTQCDSFEQ